MRKCLLSFGGALGWALVAAAVVPRPQSMNLGPGFCAAGTQPRDRDDRALWAEIGKAEAEGWNAPVELPAAEAVTAWAYNLYIHLGC